MVKLTLCKKLLILLITTALTFTSNATDTIKMLKPLLGFDKRAKHKDEIIIRSLEITEAEYGPFTFETIDVDMTPSRALASMKAGSIINIFIAPASKIWEENAIPIKVPIRQGLLSYRLLLVNQKNLYKFKEVETFDDLKKLRVGVQNDWVTTKIFKSLEMNVVTAHNFEGLFLMLDKQRSDYIPRAIYEIYDELNNRKAELSNIVIEPTLALYLPMVSYVYVSTNEPSIAKRVKSGLHKLASSGELKRIFNKYYAEDIEKANLQNRRLIEITNPYFNDKDVLNDQRFFYHTSQN